MKFGLKEVPPAHRWLAKALELTKRYEVSIYDAAYHALAIIHDGLFVTADTRYVTRVAETGSAVVLGEWYPSRRRGRPWV